MMMPDTGVPVNSFIHWSEKGNSDKKSFPFMLKKVLKWKMQTMHLL